MKPVSVEFTDAIDKTNSPGVEVQLWMSNFSKKEAMADRTSYLDLASVGNIAERIEKGLNEFRAGDINLRVYNIGDFFLTDYNPSAEPSETGDGLFELDDIIRIQLRFKFQGIADTLTKFDGYLDRDSIRRKGKNLIEFHCISWHKNLENWDAEKVADKENNPFKNIDGLFWVYGGYSHPTIIDNKGEMGVHTLKHTFEKIDPDVTKHHYWQYDNGDKVQEDGNFPVEVWNEYKDAEGSLAQKEQGFKFKIDNSILLPEESKEDTIVVIWDYEKGFMIPAYWYENIHLVTAVNHLLDSVGKEEFHLDGVIDTRKIQVRDVELGTGSSIFSYYNSVASDKKCYSCISMGDDWFVFNLDDEIRKVEKTSNSTLSYDLIDTVSGGLKIYKMWKVGDNVWGIMGSSSSNITKIFKLSDWDGTPILTEYSINLFGSYVLSKAGVNINKENAYWSNIQKLYYVLEHTGGTAGIKIAVFDLTAETFTELHYNSTKILQSGMSLQFGYIRFYTTSSWFVKYRVSTDIWTDLNVNRQPKDTNEEVVSSGNNHRCGHSTHHLYGLILNVAHYWEENWVDIIEYLFASFEGIFGWNENKTYITQSVSATELTDDAFNTILYDQESPPCLFNEESGCFFGIAHNKTGDNFYIGWMFCNKRNAFIERADFTDMTIRTALDDLAKTFMCNYQRGSYDSAFFHYREFARGDIYNLTTSQYYHPPKIALWKEQYDGVIVKGQDLQGEPLEWASGNIIGLKTRVLTIESRFLSDALGQTVAMWMHEFFKRKRRVFYVNLKFLMQLELQDEIKFKLPWDDSTWLYAFAYELEYQHDKHQIRAKLVELEGVETHPLSISQVSRRELVSS